jgi:HSP20 family molecular chaperone IbpA
MSTTPAEFFMDLVRNNLMNQTGNFSSHSNIPNFINNSLNPNNKKIPVDMINEEKTIYIYAELPGVQKENIDIDIFNNKLSIIAEKTLSYESPDVSEIKTGKFERVITLPICITRKETVTTSFVNGVLKIKINKLIEEENAFKIKVGNDNSN